MIVPNLNPAQLKASGTRPFSASLRTPRGGDQSFARLRNDGQATPRLPPNPNASPGEEEPWLFRFGRSLNTMDVWKMGFSRVIIFGAHHWVSSETAAAEVSEAFGAQQPIAGLGAEHKETLEALIAPAFLRGDVLLAVQCSQFSMLPDAERETCLANAAKFIDAVSNVWTQYDEMNDADLGAVVVVMEGFSGSSLSADWGTADGPVVYPVAELDEEFSAFFK